jgi:hypothetical protein
MSSSNHHFLAILPLFAILSISPMQLDSKLDSGRSIASEVIVSQPKYEARAAKIDRTKIVIDKDLDLNCYNDREGAFRKRLIEVKEAYKVDETQKEAVSLQKIKIDALISSLVDLEEDMKALKEKKVDPKADVAMRDFKIILEGLLEDEAKNEDIVAKAEAAKEEAPQVATTKPEVKPEAEAEKPAKDEPKKEDDALCDLQEKNLVLTKQVEELLAQQKTIMENMVSMTQMMMQIHQRSQMLPSWMTNGSMMGQQQPQQYPTMPNLGNGQWIFIPQNSMQVASGQAWEPNVQTQTPQLGQGTFQQAAQGPFNYQPLPQAPIWNNSVPSMSYSPANFGSSPASFNFSQNTNLAANFGV